MADISAIKLPNNTTYTIKDNNALPLTGGSVTGPVSFGDSVSIDEATIGDLVVNGSGSFTNNIQANTINGVIVGNSPKFTDTNTTYSAGTGLSLSSTTFNHTNSVTAQTTQAVYPIKIDAQGHISAYGSAVTIPTVPSNIVNTITTTAGAHTAISNQKGNVSFNVPTKTSHLTNDSGFITSYSDKKLEVAAVTSGTTYYPIVGTGTTAATRQFDTTGLEYYNSSGTTSANGRAMLVLGNGTASGTGGNKRGELKIYGTGSAGHIIRSSIPDNIGHDIYLPDDSGTVALTKDIPTKTSDLTNDSGFISNIKTINNTSLVGSGNVAVQPTLVSGTNIKTINNESILGSGNISIVNTRGTPASGGTILSLVNTGDMYTWDNKTQVQIIRW